MEQKKCPFCGKDLKQKEGKREKKFCNSTCRSGFWQKNNKKEKKYKLVPIEEYKKLTEQPNKTHDADKLKEPVNDEPKQYQEPKKEEQPPERKQGESSLDYRIRRAEWFEQRNKK